MWTFYAHKRTHQVGKFGAIPPTDPNDISQSTPDCWPIFEFQALKNCCGRPICNEVCISKSWSPSTRCEIFRGQCPIAPEIWAFEKVDWVGFFPIDDILLPSGDIRDQIAKSDIWCYWAAKFFGRGTANIWLNFKNYSHHRTCGKVWP